MIPTTKYRVEHSWQRRAPPRRLTGRNAPPMPTPVMAPPAPLTAGQVKAMTKREARTQMAAVAKYRNWVKGQGNAALYARMTAEFNMLLRRLKRRD